jgi:hypothetical protein
MFFGQKVAVEVAVEDVLAWKKVAAEKLAVPLGKLVVRHALTFLDALFETTYFVDEQELDGVGEAGKVSPSSPPLRRDSLSRNRASFAWHG